MLDQFTTVCVYVNTICLLTGITYGMIYLTVKGYNTLRIKITRIEEFFHQLVNLVNLMNDIEKNKLLKATPSINIIRNDLVEICNKDGHAPLRVDAPAPISAQLPVPERLPASKQLPVPTPDVPVCNIHTVQVPVPAQGITRTV
jgi:hypothetical protein